ncbi:hypothetical protein BCR15_09030 [Tessaracoccus lapidicaptus]|uniref:Uncharacterized protein n=1 Tax=Tessaracoccus lapidicaptus TaxID=1427523 RepID=A0A1C0AI82_9ACTN|nr:MULTISPECIES: hypothetical protein [Tessaracoccus]AQX16782.1 hypothetical protein BKM78_13330 [Tessaracoccus sp. T2.5-30]OCL31757.1 hypothetical protein BCR15_09030 [Tessaracoccus lapidicaptus]VEP41554.1 hypothetical protein TLA_TLA_02683 [Tessaracoccus lapidicaptus]
MNATLAAVSSAPLGSLIKTKFDTAVVRYDAWFLVFVAVILALAAALLAGMAIWCVVNQKGRFTGNWYWKSGWQVALECRR